MCPERNINPLYGGLELQKEIDYPYTLLSKNFKLSLRELINPRNHNPLDEINVLGIVGGGFRGLSSCSN